MFVSSRPHCLRVSAGRQAQGTRVGGLENKTGEDITGRCTVVAAHALRMGSARGAG